MSEPITCFKGRYDFLSNFYEAPIKLEGWNFATVEHAFQAYKMTNAIDAERVRLAKTPGQAKRLARKLTMRLDWEDIKETVMLLCLYEKFKIPYLKQKLLETEDRELIEGNDWGDEYWGVCHGKGLNRLGIILMHIRKELRQC